MPSARKLSNKAGAPGKASTGIAGFDVITRGGLPQGCTTLLVGGPGSGKTIFGLQFLAHGARACAEPGIFVAFEERSKRLLANAASFGWKLAELTPKRLYFMDAQPDPDLVQSGDFDIDGMLAALELETRTMGARRIVFDALDIVLALLPDEAAKRREIYRLHEWLLARRLSAIITLKADADTTNAVSQHAFGFMQFMVDCAVILNQGMLGGISVRSLRVQKYRGSGFDENESRFRIGASGFEVASGDTGNPAARSDGLQLDAEVAAIELRLKSLQAELLAKQAGQSLLSAGRK
jgi:circadian clock protein KaiC